MLPDLCVLKGWSQSAHTERGPGAAASVIDVDHRELERVLGARQ